MSNLAFSPFFLGRWPTYDIIRIIRIKLVLNNWHFRRESKEHKNSWLCLIIGSFFIGWIFFLSLFCILKLDLRKRKKLITNRWKEYNDSKQNLGYTNKLLNSSGAQVIAFLWIIVFDYVNLLSFGKKSIHLINVSFNSFPTFKQIYGNRCTTILLDLFERDRRWCRIACTRYSVVIIVW